MKSLLPLILAGILEAQSPPGQPPRFEDYPVKEVFSGTPAPLVLEIPEERVLDDVFRDAVNKGWGVFNGVTGKEFQTPGPNFAGHYVIANFGCGQTAGHCLGAAILDAQTGRVYRPPVPEFGGAWHTYFGVIATGSLAPHPPFSLHKFPLRSPLAYRLNSRLFMADICEEHVLTYGPPVIVPEEFGEGQPKRCGIHYYLMEADGLKLIRRTVE